jgi:hypothetical protein
MRTPVLGWGTGVIHNPDKHLQKETENLAPWYWHCRRAFRHLSLIEHRIGSHVCWPGGQHLLFTVDQVAGVEACDFETVSVSNRVGGTSLDAVPAENTPVVVDVVNLGVALGTTDAMLGRILSRLNINAVRGTGRRAQKTGYALFQSVLIALQDVHAAKALLKLGAPKRSRPIGIVLYLRGLEHLHESDAHPLGDGGNVLQHWHT